MYVCICLFVFRQKVKQCDKLNGAILKNKYKMCSIVTSCSVRHNVDSHAV